MATLVELPEEIEYIKSIDNPSVKPIVLPTVISKRANFQSDEDVLLLLLTELDKFDD